MIISHKHKFIFLKTNKTGGTSTEHFLSSLCGPNDIVTPIKHIHSDKKTYGNLNSNHKNYEKYNLSEHDSALIVSKKYPKLFNLNYKVICNCRNPWSRYVSRFRFRFFHKGQKPTFSIDSPSDFQFWLKNCQNSDPLKEVTEFASVSNKVVVTDWIKLENINNDLKTFLKKLNLNIDKTLLNLKGNYKNQINYKDFYNEESKNLVTEYHKNDIEYFKYEY